jgi:tRNA-dihydrouridine synthase 3
LGNDPVGRTGWKKLRCCQYRELLYAYHWQCDILTHYEALRRIDESGVDAVMVGRGALIKPWIFQESRDQQEWEPSLDDRIAVYHTLTSYMKEYFGSDDLGRQKSWTFLPWHFSFFSRFKAYPKDDFNDASLTTPLM